MHPLYSRLLLLRHGEVVQSYALQSGAIGNYFLSLLLISVGALKQIITMRHLLHQKKDPPSELQLFKDSIEQSGVPLEF